MKLCKRCFKEFDENLEYSPARELGDMFSSDIGDDAEGICPECREELGVMNLMGFGQ